MKTNLFLLAVALLFTVSCNRPLSEPGSDGLWSVERSIEWQNKTGWLSGCNFLPSTAVNALDMWQKETFDPVTIDRELGWVEDMGFNVMRVWLNSLVWKNDPEGFKKNNVVAISWGLVAGESNTLYKWGEPVPDGSEPKLWFHDIVRRDGRLSTRLRSIR